MTATHILTNDHGVYALAEVKSTTDSQGGPAVKAAFAALVTASGTCIDHRGVLGLDTPWITAGLFPLDSRTTIIPINPS